MFSAKFIFNFLREKEAFIFILMAAICGIYSSSTPDEVTFAEILIGTGLIYFVGITRAFQILSSLGPTASSGSAYVPKYVLVSVVYLLFVPVLVGVVFQTNEMMDLIRDIIPMLYLFIPVLLMHRFVRAPKKWLLIMLIALCVVGISYSIRHFTTSGEADLSQLGKEFIWGGNNDNISQDPAVLYMMAFLGGIGIAELFCGRTMYGFVALGLAIFPWAANIASVTRSSIGLSSISILIVVVYVFTKYKVRNSFPLISVFLLTPVVAILLGDSIWGFVQNSVGLMLEKNNEHGLSGRDTEAIIIWDNANTLGLMLFGTGWGGVFASPINAGGLSRYSHNSIVFFFLKSGILGTICYCLYLYWFINILWKLKKFLVGYKDFAIVVALITPLFVSLMLEPMYKSLSCGLVLSLIPLLSLSKGYRVT